MRLASDLHNIKQTIWFSERVELFELFNAIDRKKEGELSIEMIEEFFEKNEWKKKMERGSYDAMVRLFGEERISLRDFILHFVIVS